MSELEAMAETFERMAKDLEEEEAGSAFVFRVAADMCRERMRVLFTWPNESSN